MRALHEMFDLSGEVAIVTGAAKGIGHRIAYRLAEAGAQVVVADLDYAAVRETAQDLTDNGWLAFAWKVDVGSEAEMKEMLAEIEAEYGSVDIHVNNAGTRRPGPEVDMSEVAFDRRVRRNLRSVFLGTKYAAAVMRRHDGGKIINVTSVIGPAHSDAAEHGVWGFTKNSALELAKDDITVNSIVVGSILDSEMSDPVAAATGVDATSAAIPLHRMGAPDEVATVALFLASGMSTYLTGAQLVVDGGALLS